MPGKMELSDLKSMPSRTGEGDNIYHTTLGIYPTDQYLAFVDEEQEGRGMEWSIKAKTGGELFATITKIPEREVYQAWVRGGRTSEFRLDIAGYKAEEIEKFLISYLEGMFTPEKDKQLKWSCSRTIKWEYCCKEGTLKIENLWEFTLERKMTKNYWMPIGFVRLDVGLWGISEQDQKHDFGYQRYCNDRQQQSPASEPEHPSVRLLGHRSEEEWKQNRIEALYILTAAVVLYRVVIDTWKPKE
ncbi:unnamed protein product [Cyclocybe aegerita]|uniref:Uncharacterized protein n=1 Tax=Cyclocybe aegerita TaxID=1973307 RepID=A0A8S0VQT3_CYCAE|nr:unnamed protein product [Cyclocybe aegerita]